MGVKTAKKPEPPWRGGTDPILYVRGGGFFASQRPKRAKVLAGSGLGGTQFWDAGFWICVPRHEADGVEGERSDGVLE